MTTATGREERVEELERRLDRMEAEGRTREAVERVRQGWMRLGGIAILGALGYTGFVQIPGEAREQAQVAVGKAVEKAIPEELARALALAIPAELDRTMPVRLEGELERSVGPAVDAAVRSRVGAEVVDRIASMTAEIQRLLDDASLTSQRAVDVLAEVERAEERLDGSRWAGELEALGATLTELRTGFSGLEATVGAIRAKADQALATASRYGVKDLRWTSNGKDWVRTLDKSSRLQLIETSPSTWTDNYIQVVRP